MTHKGYKRDTTPWRLQLSGRTHLFFIGLSGPKINNKIQFLFQLNITIKPDILIPTIFSLNSKTVEYWEKQQNNEIFIPERIRRFLLSRESPWIPLSQREFVDFAEKIMERNLPLNGFHFPRENPWIPLHQREFHGLLPLKIWTSKIHSPTVNPWITLFQRGSLDNSLTKRIPA